MSKIFYDDLIDLGEIEAYINSVAETPEEKHELWEIVDEIVHHRVVGCILDRLNPDDHGDFLERFSENPQDEALYEYLESRTKEDIREIIKRECQLLHSHLLEELKNSVVEN